MNGPDQKTGLNVSENKTKLSLQDILKAQSQKINDKKAQEQKEIDKEAYNLEDLMVETEEKAAQQEIDKETDKLESFMVDTDSKTEDIMTLSGQQKKFEETKLNLKKITESISESQLKYNSSQEVLKDIYNTSITDNNLAEVFKQSEINSYEDLPKVEGFSESEEAINSEKLKQEVAQKIEEKRALEEKTKQDLGLTEESEEIKLEEVIDQKVQEIDKKINELKPGTPEGFVEIIADVNTKMYPLFSTLERKHISEDNYLEDKSWLNTLAKIDFSYETPDITKEAEKLGKDPQELQQAFLQKTLHEFLEQNKAKRISLTKEVDSVQEKTDLSKDNLRTNGFSAGVGIEGFSTKYNDYTNVNDEIIRIQYKNKNGHSPGDVDDDSLKNQFLGSGIGLWGYKKNSESWTVPESDKIIQTKDGKFILKKIDTKAYRDYEKKVGIIDYSIIDIQQCLISTENVKRFPLDKLFKVIENDSSDEKFSAIASDFLKNVKIPEKYTPDLIESLKKASTALKEISTITKESMTGIEVSSDFARIWDKCGGDIVKMKIYIKENFKANKDEQLKSQLEEKTKAKFNLDIDQQKFSKLIKDQDVIKGEEKIVYLTSTSRQIQEVSEKITSISREDASLKMVDGKIVVCHSKLDELNQIKQDQLAKQKEIEDKKNEPDGFLGINKKKKEDSLILLKKDEYQISQKSKESEENLRQIGIYYLQNLVNILYLTNDEKTKLLNEYGGNSNGLLKIVEDRFKNDIDLTPAQKDKIAQKKELEVKIAENKRIFEKQYN